MSENLIDAEKAFELAALRGEIERLKKENTKYKILLAELDSNANPEGICDVEVTCVLEIQRLRQMASEHELSTDDIKKLDLLHKNLKLARGEDLRVNWEGHAKKMSDTELEKIAKTQNGNSAS